MADSVQSPDSIRNDGNPVGSSLMKYKLFVFDLDETIWTVSEGLCSLVRPPFQLTAPDRLETSEGFWVQLKPGVHDLFKFLKKQKRYISLASRNDHEPAID